MLKTLIVYGTKYGSTASCAWKLGKELKEDVTLINLEESSPPPLHRFDRILIGTPIYVGRIRKKVKNFCQNNLEKLLAKETGVFVCGWSEVRARGEIEESLPLALLDDSIVGYFGGEIKLDRLNAIEQVVIEKALGNQSAPQILEENIAEFVKELNQAG